MPGYLSDCEIADIAADLADALDTPITAVRPALAQARDGYGHRKTTGAAVQVAACNALFTKPSGALLTTIAGRIGALVVWAVSVPLGTDLKPGDIVTLTATGQQYGVHAVLSPESYSPWLNVVVAQVE